MSGRPLSLQSSSEAPHDTSVLTSSRRPYAPQQQQNSSAAASSSSSFDQRYPDRSSAAATDPVSPLQDVFSDEFSLEPLDDLPSRSNTDLSRRSRLSNKSSSTTLLATEEDGPESHLSPFRDPDPKEMSDPPGSSKRPLPNNNANYVPTQSSSVARAPSDASSTTQGAPSISHRSVSTSSRFSIPRALSPYTGQTGPSHPYAMYPQGIATGRTSSVSSSSTVRASDRNAVGVAPPQHPYAMYPQNTVPEEGLEDQAAAPSIPVGFPGHDTQFTSNRRTPDELGDIVGVDGHTEQLPPYSRYPDGIPPKSEYQSPITVDESVQEAEGTSPVSPPSGVSSRIMLREGGVVPPQSMADNNLPPPDDDASGGIKERLARKGQQKVCCGVPIWIFFLVGVVLCIGAAIGGAIGGVLGTKQGEKAGGASASSSLIGMHPTSVFVTVTATTLLDATPLSTTPTNILPPPTGSFSMPASALAAEGNDCIDDKMYGVSWGCIQTGQFQYSIDDDDGVPGRVIKFNSEGGINGNFVYGPQLPFLAENEFHTRLMRDKTNMSLGPALFVYTPFDKLVIIPEEDFPPGDSVSSKELLQRSSVNGGSNKVLGQPGDKPFFCWWNSTYLEIFVYLNETSEAATSTLSSSYPQEAQTPSPTDSAILPITSTSDQYGTSHDMLFARGDDPHYYKPFPRVVKVEEKRVQASGVPPYCEQMQVLEDYRIGGPIGKPVTIDESDPTPTTSTSVIPVQPNRIKRDHHDRPPDDGNCFCRWYQP